LDNQETKNNATAHNSSAANCYTPTEKERNIMLHSLGLDRSKKAYRNFYAASEGHHSNQELENLVEHGLMIKRKDPFNDFGGILYHVTDVGKRVLGV